MPKLIASLITPQNGFRSPNWNHLKRSYSSFPGPHTGDLSDGHCAVDRGDLRTPAQASSYSSLSSHSLTCASGNNTYNR